MKRSVLLVEDNELLCECAMDGLECMGIDAHEAHDGHEALRLLKQHRYSAAFIDFDLPNGINGLQLARRSMELQPGISIILTSGYEMTETALPDGVMFVRKPYRLSQVVTALSQTGLKTRSIDAATI